MDSALAAPDACVMCVRMRPIRVDLCDNIKFPDLF